ncbi:unnamed protein product [Cochlearia groenlandica]
MLYYILTDGKNPYIHRGYNVVDVSDVIEFPEAYKLISQMTKNNPSSRPTVQDVLAHPLFWSDEDKLMFLQDVNEACKSVAKGYTDLDSTLHKLVESAGWKRIVDQNHYASSTAGYNNYYSGLLNFVRNTLCHFSQFSLNVQISSGHSSECVSSAEVAAEQSNITTIMHPPCRDKSLYVPIKLCISYCHIRHMDSGTKPGSFK